MRFEVRSLKDDGTTEVDGFVEYDGQTFEYSGVCKAIERGELIIADLEKRRQYTEADGVDFIRAMRFQYRNPYGYGVITDETVEKEQR